MKAFLLKYTKNNSSGYKLVYADNIEEAEQKLRTYFFWSSDDIHIENETIE